jgi:hypothetical protein
LVAFATAEGYSAKPDAHVPFHGYFFHMLKGQTDKARGGAKSYIVDGKMTGGFGFADQPGGRAAPKKIWGRPPQKLRPQ